MTSLYGQIVTEKDVRDAARSTIMAWVPAYTAEVCRQKSITLDPIRTYGVQAPTQPTPDELPACVIVAPGLLDKPVRRGDGTYTVTWALGVGIVLAKPTPQAGIEAVGAYVAALRTLLIQQGSLGGFAVETTWLDEECAPFGFERDRGIVRGALQFAVQIDGVADRTGGPTTPPADPSVPLLPGTVAHTGIVLTQP